MIVKTRKLGLAAFIKMKGGMLKGCNHGTFVFESERSIEDWQIEYTNSCCCAHDTELMQLRTLLRPETE